MTRVVSAEDFWATKAGEYLDMPAAPGQITYHRRPVDGGHLDVLLHWNTAGVLDGLLQHCPTRLQAPHGGLLRAGAVNIYVRADARRQGIGLALRTEAWRRGWIDVTVQQSTYTVAGAALVNAFNARHAPDRPQVSPTPWATEWP